MPFRLVLGLLLSSLVGYTGYRRRSLSASGVFGAVLVGALIFGFGGWAWGTLLVVFFVSASALSHFKASRKAVLAERFSKGGQPDLAQALANGGAGVLAALGFGFSPHALWWAAFVGAMTTVNAGTWATELGVLSRSAPRLITTGRPGPDLSGILCSSRTRHRPAAAPPLAARRLGACPRALDAACVAWPDPGHSQLPRRHLSGASR